MRLSYKDILSCRQVAFTESSVGQIDGALPNAWSRQMTWRPQHGGSGRRGYPGYRKNS